MINFGKVRSTIKPEEKIIDDYSVWVNTDIHEMEVIHENNTCTEYEFNQIQYSKDEYIKMIDEKNEEMEVQLTNTQIALCEIYEGMV